MMPDPADPLTDGKGAGESGSPAARGSHGGMEPEGTRADAPRQNTSKKNRAAYHKEWRKKNKDKVKMYGAKWRAKNKEKTGSVQ